MDHAGRGFAPVMILQIALDGAGRMVRAVPDIVDARALRQQFGAHPVMQHIELGLGEEAARDAGLVGEEEDKIAGVVEAADRFRRIRHPANTLFRSHIAVVAVDDTVAVEEGGGSLRLHHGTPLPDAAELSTSSTMATTSAAAMSRMQRWSFMVQTVR